MLGLDHVDRMLSGKVIVLELCGDEDVFTFYESVFDGTADALARLALVLVIVCSVEQWIRNFDYL